MAFVELDRRFRELGDEEPPDPDLAEAMGLKRIGWTELIAKGRVVILAEAGSGKTTEMRERARASSAAGQVAFYASVADVGQEGLDSALDCTNQERLSEWRDGTQDAWFFIDSIDEAKASGTRFEKVVRRIAQGITGAERRAHVLICGRVTDWEFRRDLASFGKYLSVPLSPNTATPQDELLQRVRHQRPTESEEVPEPPIVVLMEALDKRRVRQFAEKNGLDEVDGFLAQIDSANLWRFARRPLDLGWLVDFWRAERRLGSLSEMMERCLQERLKETVERERGDNLDTEKAFRAVERIGAAMVFTKKATVAIPDAGVSFSSDSPLDLADVLPDWSSRDRTRLLTRAVFDPGTIGRARFHNDNLGDVRSYLAARWLRRLREANLSKGALFDLLFAESYGLSVVRPSLGDTAAWLSLWDKDVAREMAQRGSNLLLGAGDPASLSPDVRRSALSSLIKELTASQDVDPIWGLDNDRLRRFAQPDLAPTVLELWPTCREHPEAARLLVRIVWLGALKDCTGLVSDLTLGAGTADAELRTFAARALLAVGDGHAISRYAELIRGEGASLPRLMLKDAFEALFPGVLNVSDLLMVLSALDDGGGSIGYDFVALAPDLVRRLQVRTDLEELLRGLLLQVRGVILQHSHDQPSRREREYFPAMIVTALQLMRLSPSDRVPVLVLDAALLVANRWVADEEEIREPLKEVLSAIHSNSARRREAFWQAAERYRAVIGRWVERGREMELLGYPPGLVAEDGDWLLEDIEGKGEAERRLAINSALDLQRGRASPANAVDRIRAVAERDDATRDAYNKWMRAREDAEQAFQPDPEIERARREQAAELDARDRSWIEFVRGLQNDSDRISRLRFPPTSGLNADLYSLYELMRASNRYGIDNIAVLERIAGLEVANAARDGLSAHWRVNIPRLRSQQSIEDRNSMWYADMLGIAGVTLEAALTPKWTERLSFEEARLAAAHATLEINGFPRWLPELARARPKEVVEVLSQEIRFELLNAGRSHCGTLENLSRAEESVGRLFATELLEILEAYPNLPLEPLSQIMRVLNPCILPKNRRRVVELGIRRFTDDETSGVAYLAAAFRYDPDQAAAVLMEKIAPLTMDAQTDLFDRFLRLTFDDMVFEPPEIGIETLERLVGLHFRTGSRSAAHERPTGVVYTPNELDMAKRARNRLFNRFAATPGRATYDALLRLREDPACPVPRARLTALAEERAVRDADRAPWRPREVYEFEINQTAIPRTPRELQELAMRHISEMEHELLHGDFEQGRTLQLLPNEAVVQGWVADRLELKWGRVYTVKRESHVAGEREPDIILGAISTGVSLPIEIKVADSWTLRELEDALTDQLCGQYLRASSARHGVLLLIHQKSRPRGWEESRSGSFLGYEEVVSHLRRRAAAIVAGEADGPQPEICSIDVSRCAAAR